MNRSKRIIGMITAAVTFASVVPVSFAAETDYEGLVLEVKNRVGIPEEYTEFESSGRYENEGETVYYFTWYTDDEDRKTIDVTAREDGFIMSYRLNDGERGRYDSLTMDETAAKDAAELFLTGADPELRGIAELERQNGYSYGGITYTVNARFHGLEFYRSIGSVTVDSENRVSGFNVELPDVEAPAADVKYIGADEGVAAYRDGIGVRTVYRTYRDENDKLVTFPVYESIDDKAIDAVTGETVEIGPSYKYGVSGGGSAENSAASSADGGYRELSESEKAEIAALNGLIGEDEAVAIINDRLNISFEPEYSQLYNDADKRYYYSFSNDTDSFTVDAQNGDVLSVYIKGDDNALSGYELGEGESAAAALVMLAPVSGQDYVYESDENAYADTDDGDVKGMSFVYKVNGIEVEGVNAHAVRSAYDGNVYYSVGLTATETYKGLSYADPAEFADVSELFYSDGSYVSLKYAESGDKIIPVFISESFTKSALTGADVDYRGEEYDAGGIEYSDAEGHWSQYAAEKLAGAGIGYGGGLLRPDEAVSPEDAAELIESAFGNTEAVGEENDGDGVITRLEAAKIIINCKGLERLAEMDIYEQPYTDITEDYGVCAILKGYGVIDDGAAEFRPDDVLTRAELLQMVYNTLVSFN